MFSVISSAANNNTTMYLGDPIAHRVFEAPSRSDLFQRPDFIDSVVGELEHAIIDDGVKLLSMDVFDTVLLRNNNHEMRRFMEMGARFASAVEEEIGVSLTDIDFFVARIMATKLSYRLSTPVKGCREGTLDEIHEGMLDILGLPRHLGSRTILAELDYESEVLELSPLIMPILSLAATHGVTSVLISDMYMGKGHIEDLLERKIQGAFNAKDIYSSGDHKISKRAGLLYEHVAKEYSLAPSECLHIGDNLYSDYVMARRQGWKSLFIPVTDQETGLLDQDECDVKQKLLSCGVYLDHLL